MDELHWPLNVLSRAVTYNNMTAASQSIGLSQPQISRLVKKIEQELEITLIDRSSPRNSRWTSEARSLAEIYQRATKNLESSLKSLKQDHFPRNLRIGTLEGLAVKALEFGHLTLKETPLHNLHLDIFDQNDMEAKYLIGELDMIFTSRPLGKSKYKHMKTLGHQFFDHFNHELGAHVFSPFEWGLKKSTSKEGSQSELNFISNSLTLRRQWLESWGGNGQLPSPIQEGAHVPQGSTPVFVIAQDYLHAEIWELL